MTKGSVKHTGQSESEVSEERVDLNETQKVVSTQKTNLSLSLSQFK